MKTLTKAIEQIAVKSMRKKSVAAEFSFLLVIFIILKLFTSFVSIVAGYTYLNSVITKLTTSVQLSIVITVVALFLIEFITQISLQRLFKFIYKKQFQFVILMLVTVGVFFAISSYLSLKGIAILTSKKADLTVEIVRKYDDKKAYIKADFDQQIDYLKQQIDLVKKQTWRGKLSYKHIKLIDNYNQQIIELEKQKQTELNKLEEQKRDELKRNSIVIQNDVQKYVYIVAIIMLIQLISNAFLNWFYLLIFKEKQEYLTDFVNTQKQTIQSDVIDVYKRLFIQSNNALLNALQTGLFLNEYTTQKTDFSKSLKRPLGFINDFRINENRKENERKLNEKSSEIEKLNGVRYCKNCGKPFIPRHHKQLYCSDKCRIEFWEKRTGKRLKFKSKNKK
jgi:hypothetical protein